METQGPAARSSGRTQRGAVFHLSLEGAGEGRAEVGTRFLINPFSKGKGHLKYKPAKISVFKENVSKS